MAAKLETLVDLVIKMKSDKIFAKGKNNEEDKDLFISSVKAQLMNEIYNEVKNEVKSVALLEADEMIKKKSLLQKIKDFKALTLIGVIVAFFVGMSVNQFTELVGYIKGSIELKHIVSTVGLAILFLAICFVICNCLFQYKNIKVLTKGVK